MSRKPRLHLCGHIHHAWGTSGVIGECSVHNLGPGKLVCRLKRVRPLRSRWLGETQHRDSSAVSVGTEQEG
jgi:hypothetical protein